MKLSGIMLGMMNVSRMMHNYTIPNKMTFSCITFIRMTLGRMPFTGTILRMPFTRMTTNKLSFNKITLSRMIFSMIILN
jgi:hypothetical protein